ncbi:PREDICTED: nudix hydrolase 19, chloroplastic [Theobroma cacao]|uniref:NAD(+) diphosphatase n=1 Tax=Theobroma cacao TaxID=3641 RepID=A0AB32UQ66_THECC|nr:PREDICTED: nudix hydrolase 19, chloroplastic [Theobroma cacao]
MLSLSRLLSSSSTSSRFLLSKTLTLTKRTIISSLTTMSMSLNSHAFAGNPLRSKTPKTHDPFSPSSAFESLKTRLLQNPENHPPPESPLFKVLPFRKGRPLASSSVTGDDVVPSWHLGWISLADCEGILGKCGRQLREESLVYLGSRAEEDVVYWAIDVSEEGGLVPELGGRQFCFVELRTLMVATDWADSLAMGELAVAGHARALLEWHNLSRFCGRCGEKTVPKEAGRRKQCSNELCKIRVYPRVDPVVIMLVIDRENDRALLSRQSRFVPRMWSCLAGFIEPGESLEEAVRRETYEETGIEVGEVVYHSSQPWPVGPGSIPCQLMVGFFAYAKSLEIDVDKEELEDAQWHSREDVRKALTFAEYKKAQRTAATKVDQMCKGVERGQSLSADFNVESGELAPMFIPGPFAIAYHLISTWANEDPSTSAAALLKQPSSSISNL